VRTHDLDLRSEFFFTGIFLFILRSLKVNFVKVQLQVGAAAGVALAETERRRNARWKLASTTRAPAWLALLVQACGNQEVEAHTRLIGRRRAGKLWKLLCEAEGTAPVAPQSRRCTVTRELAALAQSPFQGAARGTRPRASSPWRHWRTSTRN